ncbi:hypothetical protein GW17_00038184 [Ensete ventricosum]|nr:hypothetical protein GW17_00038184 [Ensete ventricosum]
MHNSLLEQRWSSLPTDFDVQRLTLQRKETGQQLKRKLARGIWLAISKNLRCLFDQPSQPWNQELRYRCIGQPLAGIDDVKIAFHFATPDIIESQDEASPGSIRSLIAAPSQLT